MMKVVNFVLFAVISIVLTVQVLSRNVYAEDKVKLNSVRINNSTIPESNWDDISINIKDSVTFYYNISEPSIEFSEIYYKVFLNGKIVESDFNSEKENYITLKNLKTGSYIFKITANSENKREAIPVILQFSVHNFQNNVKDKPMDTVVSAFDVKTLILYGLIIISIIQLFIIGFLIWKKRSRNLQTAESRSNTERKGRFNEREKFESSINRKGKNYEKINLELLTELNEIQYSYEQLKKQFSDLKDTNKSLYNQVSSLQSNIRILEDANVDLAKQKEKLLESKHNLEDLQEQKDKLFAMAVHDIKNPAAAIRSYVELLESYDLNANEQQEIMQSLVDTSSRIVSLAQEMSTIMAQQKLQEELKLQSGSIKSLIDLICNRNYAYAKKKNIKLINNSSPHTPETQIDIEKIEEVIDNLINNAIKFAPQDTVVQVRTFFNENKITVEVVDDGVGLSNEDIKSAFEKGAKLSARPTGDEPSSGLGLWIVKNIIEEHQGRVWVQSKLGVGSTFAFELPIKRKIQEELV